MPPLEDKLLTYLNLFFSILHKTKKSITKKGSINKKIIVLISLYVKKV